MGYEEIRTNSPIIEVAGFLMSVHILKGGYAQLDYLGQPPSQLS